MFKIHTFSLFLFLATISMPLFGTMGQGGENPGHPLYEFVKNGVICSALCALSKAVWEAAQSAPCTINATCSTVQKIITSNPAYPPIAIAASACLLAEGAWHLIKMRQNMIDLSEEMNKKR